MEATKKEKEVTLGSGKARIEKSMEVMVPAFADDAMFKYFTYQHSPEKRKVLLRVMLHLFAQLGCAGGGSLLEADGWGACAVYLPPGKVMPMMTAIFHRGVLSALFQLGLTSCKRAYTDYLKLVDGLKRKHLTAEERQNGYGYLAVIATAPARQGQGLGSVLLRRMQAMAGDRPIWLESSSMGSRRLYERHGFVVAEEVVIGRGRVGADGLEAATPEETVGVTFWVMVWRRPEKEQVAATIGQ
ncbi:hypothetical protein PG990_001105 [Apiospora arundinis]|uniref:N-acetyltransferase n=1 Tax=Apiospora arundinis TaxID=335852 RepID=A0ABR2I148_9PEZI